jgi:RNA polymerase sigma-70 factor (ECF subfamily)
MSLAIDWLKPRPAEDPMSYVDDVFRYAHARLGHREDAEDVAIEVVHSLPNPCHRTDLRPYMIGMARRKVAERLRRRRPDQILGREPSVRIDRQLDEAAAVTATLGHLAEEHRELLLMKYVLGMSSAEIGKIVGKKPASVDSSMQKARDAFSKHWKANDEEVP